ncbi:SDR family NAD(P)-dependent oxidoreductase [Leptospira biflexa]|uniref:SDR family NAD(P)-dependent oxidoreductase n=1 Tax=Leptospira biflexa TaxID=172 RepID=UPI0010828B8D|nr:SDR family NAD(P)-dependent oxidoreductase [Leptospira biflexa]TGM37404.1 SDR family NAD(P)-dependent oxidoreductase [Leptospira biflexa]TGM40741.1 SDR family NAD(P)-dependent oxidoreductase [Leptospira biflexa]TGM46945.1 SDR family NAD(P)-dependent oxidoreductase [Leptospira biflexa]TGM50589.1 SDR family NAD(P)-dependent oxidoreductase [Leptospira biflexa]
MKLASKKIVLTNGSSPLGKELLSLLLGEGALVVVGDINPEVIPNHVNLQKYKIDPCKPDQIERLIESAIETLDKIDIFIINSEQFSYAEDEKENWAGLKYLFQTNSLGPIFAIQRLTNLISVGLHIILVSSEVSFYPTPGYGLYGASKHAFDYFWDSYRKQVGKNFHFSRVVAKTPGNSNPSRLAKKVFRSILRPKHSRYESWSQWFQKKSLEIFPFFFFFRSLLYEFRLKVEKKKKNLPLPHNQSNET